jgi:hypothetical protein
MPVACPPACRFVSDCASYLQSCVRPATDIFISASQMVASIVVLPLVYNGTIIGGMYFTKETCSNFQVGGLPALAQLTPGSPLGC